MNEIPNKLNKEYLQGKFWQNGWTIEEEDFGSGFVATFVANNIQIYFIVGLLFL